MPIGITSSVLAKHSQRHVLLPHNYCVPKDIRLVLVDNLVAIADKRGVPVKGRQTWLAKETGISQSYFSKLLDPNNQTVPSIETIATIAQGLGMQAWELLVDEPSAREAAWKRMLG